MNECEGKMKTSSKDGKKKVLKFLVEVETDKWESAGWANYVRLALVGMMIPVTKVVKL